MQQRFENFEELSQYKQDLKKKDKEIQLNNEIQFLKYIHNQQLQKKNNEIITLKYVYEQELQKKEDEIITLKYVYEQELQKKNNEINKIIKNNAKQINDDILLAHEDKQKLTKENKELTKKINELNEIIADYKKDLTNEKNNSKKLQNDYNLLQTEFNEYIETIKNIKLIIMFNDVCKNLNIENDLQCNTPYNKQLNKQLKCLRNERNDKCHYIDENITNKKYINDKYINFYNICNNNLQNVNNINTIYSDLLKYVLNKIELKLYNNIKFINNKQLNAWWNI